MAHLIISGLRWLTNHLLSFVVILAVLVGGKWFYTQLQAANVERDRVNAIQAARPELVNALLSASRLVDQQKQQIQHIAKAGYGTGTGTGKAKQELDRIIELKTAERNAITSRSPFNGLPTASDFQRFAVLEMEIGALTSLSEGAGQHELNFRDIAFDRQQWTTKYDKHSLIRAQWEKDEREKESIRTGSQLAHRIPWTSAHSRIEQLIEHQIGLAEQADDLKKEIEEIKSALQKKEKARDDAAKAVDIVSANVEGALKRADEKLADEIKRRSNSFFWTASESFWPAVRDQLPAAAGIMLAAILLPVGIKLMFFFVIAPWAARQPPIQILPLADSATPVDALLSVGYVQSGKPSAVSIAIEIGPEQELLVQPDYIQTSSVNAGKATQWLLDWRFPLTSLAAGLYALTRIAPGQSETVVVSSVDDPLMEVAALQIPAGSALVVQPRALVGLVQTRSSPLKITSHWRITHLHSWLTLQFRYLAFHGPCTLILKGCRGVRVEQAENGRLLNQSATLGFSANVLYSVRRCETFVAYWRGIDELFNDQFSGTDGIYVYEEMPALHRKGGVTGRGFEGLTDSVLKIFGV